MKLKFKATRAANVDVCNEVVDAVDTGDISNLICVSMRVCDWKCMLLKVYF